MATNTEDGPVFTRNLDIVNTIACVSVKVIIMIYGSLDLIKLCCVLHKDKYWQ